MLKSFEFLICFINCNSLVLFDMANTILFSEGIHTLKKTIPPDERKESSENA